VAQNLLGPVCPVPLTVRGKANNYAFLLCRVDRFEEIKSLLCRMIPVARRVVGDNDETTLKMRWCFAQTLYKADGATINDIREAVKTLEDTVRISRRVFGSSHPLVMAIVGSLRQARAFQSFRDALPGGA